ncbi:polymorphic toxin type 15 domain-containing protein [Sporolactobacillus sp. KGMB 08714]|uniref:polymorphic toxin type 15 domain-containing protein n=1 Tax=Sporolactobacillus sp. KGMB 08714 TaxID=3064704 RepID=UPI002FBE942E
MGEDVSYRSASWDDMGRAIAQISGWGGALERMRQMDRTLQQIQKAIDDLDEDRRLWFSYKSQAGALDKLGDDYRKLDTFTGEAGDAVSRHIDDPFYKQMDAFVAEMAQVSISQYHTQNTLNVKEYRAASPLASVAAYEPVTKQSITFDDLFNSSSLMAASLKKEYESYRAAAGKQAGDVTFDQYKESIQYSRGFDYQSIKDKQMDQEFWVNLGIGAAIVILTIACPPAGIAAGAAYGAMQLTDAATGTSLISGRKLSTEERVTEGIFGVLDGVPAFKAAGAFSAIGRMGTKGVTTLGDLTKTMGRASGRRLIQLKQISRAGIDSVKQAAANAGDRLSLGGLQPEFAGASGVGGAGGGESLIQDVKSTFRQMASKESVNPQINYSKIEDVQGAGRAVKHLDDVPRIKEIEVKFNQSAKHDAEEFERQLKGQEKGMNELTVDEYLRNRERYLAKGRAIEGNAAQQAARENAYLERVSELRRKGLSLEDAEKQANEWLDTQAALHNPDQIAGGRAVNIGGMGDKGVNSSIGIQWRYRIDVVDEQIRDMAKKMTPEQLKNTYLNVKLTH